MRYRACGAETRSVAPAERSPADQEKLRFFLYHPYTEDLLQVLGLMQDLRIVAT